MERCIKQFCTALEDALNDQRFVALTCSKAPKGSALVSLRIRPVQLKGQDLLNFQYRHTTRDVTKNYNNQEALSTIQLLLQQFRDIHLFFSGCEWQLACSKKGKWRLLKRTSSDTPVVGDKQHDRQKKRLIDPGRPFLQELGVCDANGTVLPSMSRKWKQINTFIGLLDAALDKTKLPTDRPWRAVDFGSGKGYLTFAVHEHLNNLHSCHVTGVEMRSNLTSFCSESAKKLKLDHLDFFEGDIATFPHEHLDIMIALHACDTATDLALHAGISAGASIIMSAPCCHKELRPQIIQPEVLQPLLRFGVHLGQEADMLTDSLRALLLEANGYDVSLLEFVSLEHTAKNKMLLALKRDTISEGKRISALEQFSELKDFYGIKTFKLEQLLQL